MLTSSSRNTWDVHVASVWLSVHLDGWVILLSCDEVSTALFTYPLSYVLFCFDFFFLLWIQLLWIFWVCFYGKNVFWFLWGKYFREERVTHGVGRCVTLKETASFLNWSSLYTPSKDIWVIVVVGTHRHLGSLNLSLAMLAMTLHICFTPCWWTRRCWTTFICSPAICNLHLWHAS